MTTRRSKHLTQAGKDDARDPAVVAIHEELTRRFSALYALAQNSNHVFGSPLGPFTLRGRSYHLPRFVYFGPRSSDESVRLAFYAGFDGADVRATAALLHLVERLALAPEVGHALNLSFFPLVNPSGLRVASRLTADGVDLVNAHWGRSSAPEVELLRNDARLRAYHGFVRIETVPVTEIVGAVRWAGSTTASGDVAVFASDPGDVFPMRWESSAHVAPPAAGPLTLADDFAFRPFELIVRIPATWSAAVHREAITQVLSRFIVRYRASFSYGIHL